MKSGIGFSDPAGGIKEIMGAMRNNIQRPGRRGSAALPGLIVKRA
jgi:hypothetical protein